MSKKFEIKQTKNYNGVKLVMKIINLREIKSHDNIFNLFINAANENKLEYTLESFASIFNLTPNQMEFIGFGLRPLEENEGGLGYIRNILDTSRAKTALGTIKYLLKREKYIQFNVNYDQIIDNDEYVGFCSLLLNIADFYGYSFEKLEVALDGTYGIYIFILR